MTGYGPTPPSSASVQTQKLSGDKLPSAALEQHGRILTQGRLLQCGDPPYDRDVSERNRDTIDLRTLLRRRLRIAGLGCWPDRHVFRLAGSASAGAGRKHKSLCGDRRYAFGGSVRHPDL